MKTGRTLSELAQEIERQGNDRRDYVADTRSMVMDTVTHGMRLTIANGGDTSYDVNDNAHRQIGARLGIPAKYYDRMREEAPELLAGNVNHWFEESPERRLVRTLDGRARAFLSDRYQRIDNVDVAQVALPILAEHAAKGSLTVQSCEITDKKMYIKAVSPKLEGEVKRGDVVQAGVAISNSEIGLGSVSIQPFALRLICLNGMILPDSRFRKYHVGGRIEAGSETAEVWRNDTMAADDRAILLKVRDVVAAALDEADFARTLDKLRAAAEDRVEGNPVKAVETLGKTVGISEGEQAGVLRHLIEGGDLSRWGMANAVTRLANDVADYDRATELEMTGGKVINLAPAEWAAIREAA